ncbi:hypothetical protein, partial [Myxococcus fulvus]|uniref:hypothetical protein n=1 Tax=Myxococcus fulvus TaxID=33 RepID=UPI0020C102C4
AGRPPDSPGLAAGESAPAARSIDSEVLAAGVSRRQVHRLRDARGRCVPPPGPSTPRCSRPVCPAARSIDSEVLAAGESAPAARSIDSEVLAAGESAPAARPIDSETLAVSESRRQVHRLRGACAR